MFVSSRRCACAGQARAHTEVLPLANPRLCCHEHPGLPQALGSQDKNETQDEEGDCAVSQSSTRDTRGGPRAVGRGCWAWQGHTPGWQCHHSGAVAPLAPGLAPAQLRGAHSHGKRSSRVRESQARGAAPPGAVGPPGGCPGAPE